MRKKILIAEASDTTRGVAENVLRQNGFEVISVSTGDKALEVLELSRPNLILIDSTLTIKGKKSLFDRLQEDPRASSIPFMLIVDEGDTSSPYPDEVKITRPLDPQDMLTKVSALAGSSPSQAAQSGGDNPLDTSVEDELLDAALGLDRIDVTDSEIMDPSTVTKKGKSHSIEKTIGMEHDHQEDEDSGKNKVESLRIDDAGSEIEHKDSKNPSKTGKLEILSDHEQFGIGDESLLEPSDEYANHDYEWFINEMKKDVTGAGKKAPQKSSEEIKPSKPSAHVGKAPAPPNQSTGKAKSDKGAGVEKFIEEFKKEVESFSDAPHSAPPKPAPKAATATKTAPPSPPPASPERVAVSHSQVEMFTRELVQALAQKIAEKIANKIDPDKLLSLIKNEIMANSQKR